MADDFLNDEEGVGAETPEAGGGGKKDGFLPKLIVQILKYVAIGLGAVVFIVTVSVITNMVLNSGQKTSTLPDISEEYAGSRPILTWFSNIGEMRGRTADESMHTYVIEVLLGYKEEKKALQTEMIQRTPEIRDLVRLFFSGKTADEIRRIDNDSLLKDQLKTTINRILTTGQIDAVIFGAKEVVDF